MLRRSAENRLLRPIINLLEANPRPSCSLVRAMVPHLPVLSRRNFTSGLIYLIFGRSLVAQRPRRIVSTAPSITEALFALDLGSQVVGVSQYCDFPPEVAQLPKVGTDIKPNLEAIARLAPDLVVLQTAPPDLTDRLRASHIEFVEVPHGTLNDVLAGIQIIAKSAGVSDRSVALVNGIKSSLQNIRKKARTAPSPHVIQARSWNLLAVGELWAASRGVHIPTVMRTGYIAGSILIAATIALTGPIGFVGLVVPHLVRTKVSADYRILLPSAFFFGGHYSQFATHLAA